MHSLAVLTIKLSGRLHRILGNLAPKPSAYLSKKVAS